MVNLPLSKPLWAVRFFWVNGISEVGYVYASDKGGAALVALAELSETQLKELDPANPIKVLGPGSGSPTSRRGVFR